jgi:hypothetical protein
MKPRTLTSPDRCTWHLLFPLGGKELITRRRAGTDKVTTEEVTHDEAYCTALVTGFDRYVRASSAMGMPFQPIPVSIDHAVSDKVLGRTTEVDPARVADVMALSYLPASTANAPAGVYALICWGYSMGMDGRRYLSPTTSAFHRMRSGEKIPGPFLAEVGLVAAPALDTIGSIDERLELQAFPLPPYLTLPEPGTDPLEPMTLRSLSTPGSDVIQRGATYLEPAEDEMTKDELKALMMEVLDSDEYEERMYRRMMKRMASPTMPVADPDAQMPTPDPADTLEQRAMKVATDIHTTAAMGLVQRCSLLPKDAPVYVQRALAGESVSDLVKDYSALAQTTGHATGTPAETTQRSAQIISMGKIGAEVAEKGTPLHERRAKMEQLRADYIQRGYTVEG